MLGFDDWDTWSVLGMKSLAAVKARNDTGEVIPPKISGVQK